jgi:hypothetical protein
MAWVMWSCHSAKELGALYARSAPEYDSYDSLFIDVSTNTFERRLKSNHYIVPYMHLFGSFTYTDNELTLIPVYGTHKYFESDNDSSITIRVFDAVNPSEQLLGMVISIPETGLDSLLKGNQHSFPSDFLLNKELKVKSFLSGPCTFTPSLPGEYHCYLYDSGFNKDILFFEKRGNRLFRKNVPHKYQDDALLLVPKKESGGN